MKTIELTKGRVALVDDEDYEWLILFKWHCTSKGYASRSVYNSETKKMGRVYMHRLIVGITDSSSQIDHIDGNRLNNQRENLRLANFSQNQANSPKEKGKTSRFKGVTWNKTGKSWMSVIIVNAQNMYLGNYQTQEAAALAYNDAAIKYFGSFALLNEFTEEEKQIALSHPVKKATSSKYRGVVWNKRGKSWQVSVFSSGKQVHVGYFKDEVEAAKAYNEAAKTYYGTRAKLNPV